MLPEVAMGFAYHRNRIPMLLLLGLALAATTSQAWGQLTSAEPWPVDLAGYDPSCGVEVRRLPASEGERLRLEWPIADGEAGPGERLPPAKDLAAVLGVNTNTVLRALRQLRDEGLLEFRRGRGISVAGTPERGAVVAQAKELVQLARWHGYRLDELVRIIEDAG